MKSPVIIKGNKYGFQIVLNAELPFDELLQQVALKFRQSSGFFDQNRPVAVSFDGRALTDEEQNELVDTIVANSELTISYIIDGAKAVESQFADAIGAFEEKEKEPMPIAAEEMKAYDAEVEETEAEETFPTFPINVEEPLISEQKTEKNGQFYRGTLRSGQSIEVDGSIVILGDINPGAQVIAGGNVVVLGCLKGTVTAGYPDDKSAFVTALLMEPMQIKIGELIARSPDAKNVKLKKRPRKKQPELEAKIAFVEKDNIFIETITRSLISEFSMMES